MNPRLRQVLIAVGCGVLAVWIGAQVANEELMWPSLFAIVATAAVLSRLFHLSVDVIGLGMAVFGYLVGNRGFAQLMPSPYVPLMPAEAALLLATGWAVIACAYERTLPWRNDALNWCVLGWLVVGTARILFDVRTHGFEAVRDFATVYYATFFFLAQRLAPRADARRYLLGAIVAGSLLLPPLAALYEVVPEFFFDYLRIRGIPVMLYKGDLVYMFEAAGAVLLFHWARGRHRYWAWPYATLLFLLVMTKESRASMVGALAAITVLLLARRWAYPVAQLVAGTIGVAVIFIIAAVSGNGWAQNKLNTVEAHLRSIANPVASVSHQADQSAYKWDNNRFRLVWWRSVALETWQANPVFGLGFGHDLARNFLQEYNPEMADDFTARSPHSIAMTAFGRMGAVGLVVWLAFCASLVTQTWRALRRSEPMEWGLWCAVLTILVAANFGVVLEGPMGAVPFWIMLGLASGMRPAAAVPEPPVRPRTENSPAETSASLQAERAGV